MLHHPLSPKIYSNLCFYGIMRDFMILKWAYPCALTNANTHYPHFCGMH